MRATRYGPSEEAGRGRLDTNTVARLDEVAGFTGLLDVLGALRAEHAPARLLCTLDDVNQCAYTSGHASEDDRLRPDSDDADARAAHIAAALDDPGSRVAWEDLPGERLGGEADVAALVEVNRDPDAFLDDVVLVQRVPVPRDDLAIAGIPNGYFTADWNVFQNHAVIRRLAGHGYRHVGIGASLLGFDRAGAPSEDEVRAVVADLQHLYGASGAWAPLAALLPERPYLFLGYTEDFPDLTG